MAQDDITYDAVQTAGERGRLARAHRKQRRLILEMVSSLSNLSTRFLSEFARGKETGEISKVLRRCVPWDWRSSSGEVAGDTFLQWITKTSRLVNENYRIRLSRVIDIQGFSCR